MRQKAAGNDKRVPWEKWIWYHQLKGDQQMFLCTRLHLDSLGNGEAGVGCAEREKGMEAADETGPDGALVHDSKHVPDHGHHQFHAC